MIFVNLWSKVALLYFMIYSVTKNLIICELNVISRIQFSYHCALRGIPETQQGLYVDLKVYYGSFFLSGIYNIIIIYFHYEYLDKC